MEAQQAGTTRRLSRLPRSEAELQSAEIDLLAAINDIFFKKLAISALEREHLQFAYTQEMWYNKLPRLNLSFGESP